MKNRSKKIITSLLAVIPLLAAVTPHPAFAVLGIPSLSVSNFFFEGSALVTEFFVAVAGSLLAITATLLNATLTATLNMSTIVDNTPAIGVAWTTIRDFGSLFIIFMLLDASIRIILGIGSDVGKLIKNIVIAGLLINFSLFFTKLAVDASNIVSLSFYSAIAPTSLGQNNGQQVAASGSAAGSLVGLVTSALDDGGLANVFMQSLDLQAVIAATPISSSSPQLGNENWNITLANIGSVVLMAFAAISFLAAAIAFAVRIGVLILLMAFSPVWFIAMIFPQLSKYSKQWSGMLYSMCVFMPVYMLLMYVAMSVLNDPHFFCFAQAGATAVCPNPGTTNITGGGVVSIGTLVTPHFIGIVLQYIIAMLLINAPLAAAISVAGDGADFMKKLLGDVSKWGQGAIQGVGQGAWRQTGGRLASTLARNEGFKNLASKSIVFDTLHSGTQSIAANYNEAVDKSAKRKDDRRKELGFDETKAAAIQNRIRDLNVGIAQAKAAGLTTGVAYMTIKNQLDLAKREALDNETARAKDFTDRTSEDDPTLGGLGGLYNRLTRSNPVASAKSAIFVHEKQMKRAEEDLAENKADLKKLEADIKNSGVTDPVTGLAIGNTAQAAEKSRLLNEIADSTRDIRDHKNVIENLNLKAKLK